MVINISEECIISIFTQRRRGNLKTKQIKIKRKKERDV